MTPFTDTGGVGTRALETLAQISPASPSENRWEAETELSSQPPCGTASAAPSAISWEAPVVMSANDPLCAAQRVGMIASCTKPRIVGRITCSAPKLRQEVPSSASVNGPKVWPSTLNCGIL